MSTLTKLDRPSRPGPTPVASVIDWDPLLERALRGEGVSTVYQPIIDLHRLMVVGYEGLVRFNGPSHLTPDRWFAAAASRGVLAELEAVTLRRIVERRSSLPPNCFLTLNVEPESLLSPQVDALFSELGDLRGFVVEITEHRPIVDRTGTDRVLGALRRAGALIAVDDAGAGYSGLQQILDLRPSFLKVDRALVAGVDGDEAKAALIEMLGVFANKIDAWLLAEGVETEGEARRLIDLGVPLAQGYFFARPTGPWASVEDRVVGPLRAQAEASQSETLHALVEIVGWVDAEAVASATQRIRQGGATTVVVLADDRRPVGVLTADAVLRGESPTPLLANVNTSIREIGHRLSTRRPSDTSTPVVVTDNAGRYVGVVTVPRLLAALAEL